MVRDVGKLSLLDVRITHTRRSACQHIFGELARRSRKFTSITLTGSRGFESLLFNWRTMTQTIRHGMLCSLISRSLNWKELDIWVRLMRSGLPYKIS
jgi:hypothetical protein